MWSEGSYHVLADMILNMGFVIRGRYQDRDEGLNTPHGHKVIYCFSIMQQQAILAQMVFCPGLPAFLSNPRAVIQDEMASSGTMI